MEQQRQIKSYRDLIAWQKAMDLVELVYELAAELPNDEKYGLSSQVKRAAVSVPANIAEGFGRGSRKDYARFLDIARASLNELETHLLIAQRLSLLKEDQIVAALGLADETQRILFGLARRLG